jgi:hypothetical protein
MGFFSAKRQRMHFSVFGGEVLARGQSERFLPEKSLSAHPEETQTQARSKRNGQSELSRGRHNSGEPIDRLDSKRPASFC